MSTQGGMEPASAATTRGIAWAVAAAAAARAVSFASLMVLARLLAPGDFGLLGFALAYVTFAETIGDLGTGSALVYWRERRDEAARVTFWASALMGVAWCALTWILAPAVVDFFDAPGSLPLLRLLAIGFVVKYLGTTHDALLRRDLRFRARLVPEIGMALVKAGVAIGLAALGAGPIALAWGQLAGLVAWTLALWALVPWRPTGRIPRDLVAPMLGYGRGIVVVNVLAALAHHSDLVVVGRILGAAALGAYHVATKIPEATISLLTWAVSRVAFPAFSRAKGESGSLRSAFLSLLSQVTLLTLPACAAMGILARPVVEVLLGREWAASVPVLQALALHAAVRSVGTHAGDVLKATGRSGMLAALAVGRTILLIPALVLGARLGPEGVAWALALTTCAGSLVNLATACRLEAIDLSAVLRALRPGLVVALAVALVSAAWIAWAPSLQPAVSLALVSLLAAAAALLAARRFAREQVASIASALRRRSATA